MNLGYSHQWPIYITNRETGKYTEFQAEPGDALIYMGCSQEHYRDTFEGDWYMQMFLHWVERGGIQAAPYEGTKNVDYYWDGNPSPLQCRDHYTSNWGKILHQKEITDLLP